MIYWNYFARHGLLKKGDGFRKKIIIFLMGSQKVRKGQVGFRGIMEDFEKFMRFLTGFLEKKLEDFLEI